MNNVREKLYPWLAILRAKHMGSERAKKLESHFGSVEKALQASAQDIAAAPGFNADIAAAVKEAAQGKFDRQIENELAWAQKEGVSILLYTDPEFPFSLQHIPAPPALLYVKGKILPGDIIALGIVGPRQASDAGRRQAGNIACQLAEAGVTIISGLAWGIDASAHKGALRSKTGRTLAVMGNGLKIIYPREHTILADQIVKRGAVISELFYDVAPQGRNFPPRNRIISGLSLGVLIVEAGERSGALITAKYALEQGKEVFALPGSVDAETSKGTNKLIHDSSAMLVTSVEDILFELEDKITFYRNELEGKIPKVDITNFPARSKSIDAAPFSLDTDTRSPKSKKKISILVTQATEAAHPAADMLGGDEQIVYNLLSTEPKHIDILCRELNWPVSRVSSVLGLLEFKSFAERESGMRFRLKEE
ncbi:MAG: DNA-protecting protein DprA [Candidatus Omnitrophota bacterium]|jgi:DNA processing protein|nr:MAG: DNA-protecting protein DprA [Candidatus Omnitrophota bacterium]